MLPGGTTVIDTGVRVVVPVRGALGSEAPVKDDQLLDVKAMKEWLAGKGLKSS
jgi:ribose transport system substrate-binding protein